MPYAVKRPLVLRAGVPVAIWFAVLSVLSVVAGYYREFTGFTNWDDEGTMMMLVRQYLRGGRLYQEISTGYGPIYFFYNWLVRSISGTCVTHDNVRGTSIAVLFACALICAWMVFRFTKSVALASLVHVLAFQTLWFFQQEPGHPQELCILLLLCLVGSGALIAELHRRSIVMALVGAIPAALLLIKVNIGIFAILAVALTISQLVPPITLLRIFKLAARVAALVLPLVLIKVHFDDPAARAYCLVVTASVAALFAGPLRSLETFSLSIRDCWIVAASFTATLAAVLLVQTVEGVSLYAVLSSLVLTQLKLNVNQRFWYVPVALSEIWFYWALTAFVTAVLFSSKRLASQKSRADIFALLKLCIGAITLAIAFWEPRRLLGFTTPFCWLLVSRPTEDPERPVTFPRLLLSTVAILQTLYAYPIAGSQTYFLRVLLILVGAVLLGDSLHAKAVRDWISRARPLARIVAFGVLACVASYYLLVVCRARQVYESFPSLSLPGAQRIHVEAKQAKEYQWLVRNLNRYCDTFVGFPGIPSLYLWTGKEPPGPLHESPGPLMIDNWLYGLSAEHQELIVKDFARFPNACVVHNQQLEEFWNKGNLDLAGLPLVNYIQSHFKTIAKMGGYEFMVRIERQHAVLADDM